jgi:hypothetical protein
MINPLLLSNIINGIRETINQPNKTIKRMYSTMENTKHFVSEALPFTDK